MTIELRLLAEVSCGGVPVAGARPADLLAALAAHPAGLSDERLVDAVWGESRPAQPGKALQVLVSRLRTQAGAGLIATYDGGYRLGLPPDSVDAWLLERLADQARRALDDADPQRALELSTRAAGLLDEVADVSGDGPLAELRVRARALEPALDRVEGLARSRSGKDADAIPFLLRAHRRDPDDSEALVALLRSEAAAAGVPAALVRYDTYRRDLADRLGVDPDDELQRVHRELLAADDPLRSGVRFEADELLGRAGDLTGLRALVRTGRLTTVLGPGGLGKTRIAHVLAREATQPRVHFVELVGVASPEDLVSEVGSALGVRHSVTRRHALSSAQLADVRGRIAEELDAVPTLLVLDNCEHVLDAVASLVAFLLVTTRELRIVTTSRAPLGIAAERVFPLSQLAASDGEELFRRRALACRPDAELDADVVADIVARLDGLPLAVELAAARIRSMSAEDVRRALTDRFSLLRGRDRSAPARHQTLTAVIGWSWDLLTVHEQRALAWLSVFQDGFGAEAASRVLGAEGLDLVDTLVEQSLLTVVEVDGDTRYRMLETVREFGAQRLVESGEADDARSAQTEWAVWVADEVRPEIFGAGQVAAIDRLIRDETNLADVLRRSLSTTDRVAAVSLLGALGGLWAVTGNFARFFAMADLGEQLLLDWDPPPELQEVTIEAVTVVLMHLGFLRPDAVDDLASVLRRLDSPRQPWTRVARAMFVDAPTFADRRTSVLTLTDDPDRRTAALAWMWAGILAENEGAIDDAWACAREALSRIDAESPVWEVATVHTQLAMLSLNRDRYEDAAHHAGLAVPLLRQLHADDDAYSMHTSLALSALREGRVDEVERVLAEAGKPPANDVTGSLVKSQVAAEVLLARGEVDRALAEFDASFATSRTFRFPGVTVTGLEPWTLIALATDLAAHTQHAATDRQRARADELAHEAARTLSVFPETGDAGIDYPVTGMALAALGTWLARRPGAVEDGVRLLALAHGFGYNRWFPVMAWDALRSPADAAAPGRLDAVLQEYGDRRGRALRAEAERVLGSLDLTSSD